MLYEVITRNQTKLLIPTLHMKYPKTFQKEMADFIKEQFGISKSKVIKAIEKGNAAQDRFEQAIYKRGQEVIANLPKDKKAFVILGRPYNTSDPMQNLSLAEKLINMDILPIPLDFLPLKDENITDSYPNIYWPNGRKIVAGARIIEKNKDLNAIYLGNFRCGPDRITSYNVCYTKLLRNALV